MTDPGYVAVVEFGTPRTRMVEKCGVETLHREAMEEIPTILAVS